MSKENAGRNVGQSTTNVWMPPETRARLEREQRDAQEVRDMIAVIRKHLAFQSQALAELSGVDLPSELREGT